MASFNLARAKNEQDKELEQLSSDAHERAMARRRRTLEISPGAGSPWEYKAIVGDYRQQRDASAFRNHELEMLQQKGKNELAVAEQKKLGMIGQGADAAQNNAVGSIETAKIEGEAKKYGFDTQKDIEENKNATSLTETEKKIAGELEVEKQRGKNATDAADASGEWNLKGIQEKGKTDVSIAQTNAQAAKDAAERKYQHEMELQAEKNLGRKPTDAEMKAFMKLREKPENKNKSSQEIWQMLGMGVS